MPWHGPVYVSSLAAAAEQATLSLRIVTDLQKIMLTCPASCSQKSASSGCASAMASTAAASSLGSSYAMSLNSISLCAFHKRVQLR